jgi:hypothetical protein
MPWYKQSGAFSVGPPSTTSIDGPLLAVTATCRCSRRAKARSSARTRQNLANVGLTHPTRWRRSMGMFETPCRRHLKPACDRG